MTDIERLRADLVNLARECDGVEGLGSGIIAHRIRCIVVDHFTSLLADYERLRGMEERVKGLSAAWMNQAKRMDTTQSFLEGRAHSLEDCAEDLVESLVPVPGGE
jgi:hypothetical protein